MPIRDNRDAAGKIIPDPADSAAIDAEHGALARDPNPEQAQQRYMLAQARKLIRLWEQGKLPLDVMREMDRIAVSSGKERGVKRS
jgi:hypothetical protein